MLINNTKDSDDGGIVFCTNISVLIGKDFSRASANVIYRRT